MTFGATVMSTEITGSESYVHLAHGEDRWVMLAHGIHVYPAETMLDLHVAPSQVMAFDADGRSLDPALREAA